MLNKRGSLVCERLVPELSLLLSIVFSYVLVEVTLAVTEQLNQLQRKPRGNLLSQRSANNKLKLIMVVVVVICRLFKVVYVDVTAKKVSL